MGADREHKARAGGQSQDKNRGKVGKCHRERDPGPEHSSEGPAEGGRAAGALSPSSSPCYRPRPGDAPGAVPGREQPAGTATPLRRARLGARVPVRGHQAPARRHLGSPDGPCAAPVPPRLGSPRLPGRTHTPGKLIIAWLQMKFNTSWGRGGGRQRGSAGSAGKRATCLNEAAAQGAAGSGRAGGEGGRGQSRGTCAALRRRASRGAAGGGGRGARAPHRTAPAAGCSGLV